MRKRFRKKRRSCPSCKPHKMGWAMRWSRREDIERRAADRLMREYRQPFVS